MSASSYEQGNTSKQEEKRWPTVWDSNKVLAKDPKDRFESVQAFAHALEQACK
jgi:hypothetical protein